MVAVMVHNGGGDAQGSQRGLEYDTVSGVYTDFIETEVLPRITKEYGIAFTRDPEGRATMGGSSGAACAFTMAWFHPELYRRVLSYSGTYVNQQSPLNPASPRGAWEYHATLIPNSPAKPIRIWMHVSERDNRYGDQEETWHNWVLANERMAAALKAKGYKYQYVYSRDSGTSIAPWSRRRCPKRSSGCGRDIRVGRSGLGAGSGSAFGAREKHRDFNRGLGFGLRAARDGHQGRKHIGEQHRDDARRHRRGRCCA